MKGQEILKNELNVTLDVEREEVTLDELSSANLSSNTEKEITDIEIDTECLFVSEGFEQNMKSQIKESVANKLKQLNGDSLTPEERKAKIREITLGVLEEYKKNFKENYEKYLDENWDRLVAEAKERKARLQSGEKEIESERDIQKELNLPQVNNIEVEESKSELSFNGKIIYPYERYDSIELIYDENNNLAKVKDRDIEVVLTDEEKENVETYFMFASIEKNLPSHEAVKVHSTYNEAFIGSIILNGRYILQSKVDEIKKQESFIKALDEIENGKSEVIQIAKETPKSVETVAQEIVETKPNIPVINLEDQNKKGIEDAEKMIAGLKKIKPISQKPLHMTDEEWAKIEARNLKSYAEAKPGVNVDGMDVVKEFMSIYKITDRAEGERLFKELQFSGQTPKVERKNLAPISMNVNSMAGGL